MRWVWHCYHAYGLGMCEVGVAFQPPTLRWVWCMGWVCVRWVWRFGVTDEMGVAFQPPHEVGVACLVSGLVACHNM